MQKNISLKLLPSEAASDIAIKKYIAESEGIYPASVKGFHVTRLSIDARSQQPRVNLTVRAFINESFQPPITRQFNFKDSGKSTRRVIIIGAGPAGLFAGLQLLESGIKPIILERGKDVRSRRRDLALLNKEGEVNPESNY